MKRRELMYIAVFSLLGFVMGGSVASVFIWTTLPGAVFSTEAWAAPLIANFDLLSRRAAVVAAGMWVVWFFIWIFVSSRYKLIYKATTHVLAVAICTVFFEPFGLELSTNPWPIAALCALLCAMLHGSSVYNYRLAYGEEAFPEEKKDPLYEEAAGLFAASDYGEASRAFSRLLESRARRPREQTKEIKLKKLICLAMLGEAQEARALFEREDWLEQGIIDFVESGLGGMSGCHVVKPADSLLSYTDAEIRQETADSVMKTVGYGKALDDVLRFDEKYARLLFSSLAAEAAFIRRYGEAAELLLSALERREARRRPVPVNEAPASLLYEMLGDVYALSGVSADQAKAYRVYSDAYAMDQSAKRILRKMKRLKGLQRI